MKIVKRLDDDLVLYAFEDDCLLVMTEDHIAVGDPVWFYIGDLKQANAQIIHDITTPADWQCGKYCFDGEAWTIAPDWIEPQGDGSENL